MTEASASNTPKPAPTSTLTAIIHKAQDGRTLTHPQDAALLIGAVIELDALRAEVAALKAKLEEAVQKIVDASELHLADESTIYNLKRKLSDQAMDLELAHAGLAKDSAEVDEIITQRNAAESRATELAARVTELAKANEALKRGLYPYLCPECGGNWNGPELAAHDDRIRRETVERIDTYFHEHPIAWQDSSIPERTRYFHRAAGITPHAGEKGEGDGQN